MLWPSSLILLWKRTEMCHGTWYVKEAESWPKGLTGLAAFTVTDTVCESWQVQLHHSVSQLEQKAATASSGKLIGVETSDHWSSCHELGNCCKKFLHQSICRVWRVLPTELAVLSWKTAQVKPCAGLWKCTNERIRGVGHPVTSDRHYHATQFIFSSSVKVFCSSQMHNLVWGLCHLLFAIIC